MCNLLCRLSDYVTRVSCSDKSPEASCVITGGPLGDQRHELHHCDIIAPSDDDGAASDLTGSSHAAEVFWRLLDMRKCPCRYHVYRRSCKRMASRICTYIYNSCDSCNTSMLILSRSCSRGLKHRCDVVFMAFRFTWFTGIAACASRLKKLAPQTWPSLSLSHLLRWIHFINY